MTLTPGTVVPASASACARCGTALGADDRVDTGERSFCRSCYATLRQQLNDAVTGMSRDIPWPSAVLGAVLGGAAGALLWWGFTVTTKLSVGLLAVAIGFLVGQGAVRFSGGKRARSLQWMAVAVSLAAFLAASYLVNMTFVNQALAAQGETRRLGFPPPSFDVFLRTIALQFGIMDVVFVAITLWQAWSIPRPLRLPAGEPA